MEWIKIIFLIGMLKIFLFGMATSQKNVITLNDGGYSNVLIAIDRKVPENMTIIENIKTMFTSASQRLYNASRNSVYWKHIKILVPNTWSNLSRFEHSRTESFHSANIIVHHFRDDEPYVENLEGCGKGALSLMHLTPEYILNEQYREDEFGDTDNVLVRNWGYYRWGLFKENYDGKGVGTAPTYESGFTNGDLNNDIPSIEGTRCSLEIKGSLSPSGCTTNPNKKDCHFIPDTESEQTAKTSLLFATRKDHVPSISEFCDDGSHNMKAPNLMNILCGKSAWKVMTEDTTDFQLVQGDVERHSDITPVFEVIALPSVRSVVLVLDVSWSMRGCKFERMIQSCRAYISRIQYGSKLGIVSFNSKVEIHAHLTDVKDFASREELKKTLPEKLPDYDTCIACGILSAIEVLGPYARGGTIVLLSDGIETESPKIKDTLDNITRAGVIIDTITISNNADPQMEDLSTNTYGTSGFCPGNCPGKKSKHCLTQQFLGTIAERPDVGTGAMLILILNSEVTIKSDPGFHVFRVDIDDTLGKNTVITVEWTESNSLLVEITGPDGTQIENNDPRYHRGDKIVTITLPQAKAGLWRIRISNITLVEHARVLVTSEQSTKYSPVIVKVLLGSHNVDCSSKPALAIYVKVEQDYLPVLNATVTAIVSSESSSTTLSLFDNGSGCDLMKDDGAYSGCFTDFRNNGRHDVKVNVLGYIDVEGGSWRERRSADSSDSVPAAAPSFMRTASGGVFKVEGYSPKAPDILPPSRIHDLVYTSFSYDNSTVTLSWTAVGDDLDQGTASRYELRYSTNISDLQNNFGSCHEITSDQLVYGNLENIKPSGLTETITVTLPERGQGIVYNFAIRAWDEAGNEGDLSNFASLSIRFIPEPIEPTTQDQSSTNPTRLGEPSTNLTTPDGSYSKPTNEQEFHPDKKYLGIWCVVVAGILAAGICIPIVCVWISYRRKYPVKFKTEDGIQVGGVEKLNPTYSNPTFAPII